jgi:hypothetical protein
MISGAKRREEKNEGKFFWEKIKMPPQTAFLQHPSGAPSRAIMNDSRKTHKKWQKHCRGGHRSEKWCNRGKFSENFREENFEKLT